MQYHRKKRRNDHQVIQNKAQNNQGQGAFAPNTVSHINTTHQSSRSSSPNQQTNQNLQQQSETSQGVEFDFGEVSIDTPISSSSQPNPNNSRQDQNNRMYSETVDSIQKKVENYRIKNDRGQARPISNNRFIQRHKDNCVPQKLYRTQPSDRIIQRQVYRTTAYEEIVDPQEAIQYLMDNYISSEVAEAIVERYRNSNKNIDLAELKVKAGPIDFENQMDQPWQHLIDDLFTQPEPEPEPDLDLDPIDDEQNPYYLRTNYSSDEDSDEDLDDNLVPQFPNDVENDPYLKHGIILQGTRVILSSNNQRISIPNNIFVRYQRDLGEGKCEVVLSDDNQTKYQVDLDDVDFTSAYELVNEPLFPDDHNITEEDVKQAKLGDCYFQAALASIAREYPNYIKEMMTDNEDGTVSVRLYHVNKENQNRPPLFTARYFKVKKSTPSNYVNQYNRGALWVHMVQKAYVVSGFSGKTKIPDNKSYEDIENGLSDHSFEMILGTQAKKTMLKEDVVENYKTEWTKNPNTPWHEDIIKMYNYRNIHMLYVYDTQQVSMIINFHRYY